MQSSSSNGRSRKAFVAFLAITFLCCVAAAIVSFPRRPAGLISSDGKGYYAWLRTLAMDRDLDFANDYQLLYPPAPLPEEMGVRTRRGLIPDKYPVGLAILEIPGFALGHVAAFVFGYERNGVSAPYQFAITIWLQVVCVAGLFALWTAATRIGASPGAAAVVTASAITATNLVQYVASPTIAHGPGLAMLCFAFLAIVTMKDRVDKTRVAAIAGLLLGLALIIRPSNAALAPFFLLFLVRSLGRSWRGWIAFAAAATVMVAVHTILTSIVWGYFTLTGYTHEGFRSGWRGVMGTLFSSRHGLFAYHPWYALMLALCVAAATRRTLRAPAIAAIASFVALTAINGTWDAWWFGDSFGNRAFVEVILPLAVVVALFITTWQPSRVVTSGLLAVLLVLSLANAVLWLGFILGRYPANGLHSLQQAHLWWLSG